MGRSKSSKKTINTKRNKKEISVVNIIFLSVLVICFAVGFIRMVVSPTDILEYENRTAAKSEMFSFDSFLSSEYQDNVEEALSDQSLFANEIKRGYNLVKSALIQSGLKPLTRYEIVSSDDINHEIIIDDNSDIGGSEIDPQQPIEIITPPAIEPVDPVIKTDPVQNTSPAIEIVPETNTSPAIETNPVTPTDSAVDTSPAIETNPAIETSPAIVDPNKHIESIKEKVDAEGGKYYSVGSGLYMYNDYVLQGVVNFKANSARIDKYFARYNELIDAYPDINFYAYYIERDSDQNYATGYRSGVSEYIKSIANLPESHVGVQEVRSFDDYKEMNYKSDHHWSYKGSYSGYKGILSMMKPDAKPLTPTDELKVGYSQGSFTKTDATANIRDDFYAYVFDFPKMDVKLNGKVVEDYGMQSKYIENARNGKDNQKLSYGGFYGNDSGLIDIYNSSGKGSLIIFGNSYDNAVVKLLASHYEHTYCIDMRYYKSGTGSYFSFAKFIESHPVDDVICIGNAYYFLQSPFIISK